MTKTQIISLLKQHGFHDGRMISFSKTTYCKRHPGHFIVFNAQLWTRRHGRLFKQADLDLTVDSPALRAAAGAAGENLYVLEENWQVQPLHPGKIRLVQELRNAVWWTRIHAEDQDIFFPLDAPLRKPKVLNLLCTEVTWREQPWYVVDLWTNAEWHNKNMGGAVVNLAGPVLKNLRIVERDQRGEKFFREPSQTRGRPVVPAFYQHAALLEYVWFSHGVAIPAFLFDSTIGRLKGLHFTWHRGHGAVHVRRDGELIGFVWPCIISAPEVVASAHAQLKLRTSRLADDRTVPYALAMAAGRQEVIKLQKMEGGAYSAAELKAKWDLTPGELQRRRRARQIMYWDSKQRFFYPRWQFTESGALLQGIHDILQLFHSDDNWRVMSYFLGPRKQLGDRRPLDLLRQGQIKEALAHALLHADQNTW